MRLIRTDIVTDELEAAIANLGAPGDVIEDDDLDTARNECSEALDACEHGDGSYQDRLEDACGHATKAHEHLSGFAARVTALHAAGQLRVGNATAATVLAATNNVLDALDEWLTWAQRELRDIA